MHEHIIFSQEYLSACSFESLYKAFCAARRARGFKRCVLLYEKNLEYNLGRLSYALCSGEYRHGGYHTFIVHDSKKRTIRAAAFTDRIVHHMVCAHIESLFEKRFIFDSYVCRIDKGTHRAIRRAKKFLYGSSNGYIRPAYYAKLDISKYFQNIDHKILFSLVCRVVRDEGMRIIIKNIIDSHHDAIQNGRAKGIPIGNLTSQLFGNIYLNELDHYVKERLYCRYYVRYMDDILICCVDKEVCACVCAHIESFVRETLLLSVHPSKKIIAPVSSGVSFLGYVLYSHTTRLRTSTIQRAHKRIIQNYALWRSGDISLLHIRDQRASWYGYAKHAQARHISNKLWEVFR